MIYGTPCPRNSLFSIFPRSSSLGSSFGRFPYQTHAGYKKRPLYCFVLESVNPLMFITYLKLLLFAVLLGVALAAPSRRSPHVLHETRALEPLDWVPVGRLDSNKVLPMRFGLVQQNLHRVEEMLRAVSHPESPTYGKHYTPADVVDTFAPSKETITAVTKWLIDSGFAPNRLRLSANKGWISLEATTSEVEDLLKAEYHVYSHASGDQQFG